MTQPIFKPWPRDPRYLIGDDGTVLGLRGRPMAGTVESRGYRVLCVRVAGRPHPVRLNVIVCETFHGPRPPGQQAAHNNGDKLDNRAANLRWATPSGNALDKARHGADPQVNKTHCPREHVLAAPNLVPSALARGWRCCLACNRAKAYCRLGSARVFAVEADRYYTQIMASS